jgi:hypothetical protein
MFRPRPSRVNSRQVIVSTSLARRALHLMPMACRAALVAIFSMMTET